MSDSIPLQQDVTLFGQRGLRLTEAASNGVHVVKHTAADSLGGVDTQYKWPAAPGGNRILQSDVSGNLSWVNSTSGSGATTSLDNLSAVAIATPLMPATDNATDLDTVGKRYKNAWLSGTLFTDKISSDLLTLDPITPGGDFSITAPNTGKLHFDTIDVLELVCDNVFFSMNSLASGAEASNWGTSTTEIDILEATTAITFTTNNVLVGKFDASATAGTTRFYLWDVTAGSLKQVKLTASQTALGVTGKFLYV